MNDNPPELCEFVLKVTCPAACGIIAGITTFLAKRGCYISELSHFDDPDSHQLFLRARFHVQDCQFNEQDLQRDFPDMAKEFSMQWSIHSTQAKTKAIIMVSEYDHCLDDILYRLHKGELNMDIVAVVSNHQTLRPMIEREGIRFIHLPVQANNKLMQEKVLTDLIVETDVELTVLARYMQILSDDFCRQFTGKIINIHHSFLPGFKGAKPYHQAYQRGVKLIGATAHYVTADLDEGPIIEQSVQVVDHTYTPNMLVAVGRDTETQALAKAISLHTEHRVFLDGNKTVIFK